MTSQFQTTPIRRDHRAQALDRVTYYGRLNIKHSAATIRMLGPVYLVAWLCEFGELGGIRRVRNAMEAEAARRGIHWWRAKTHRYDRGRYVRVVDFSRATSPNDRARAACGAAAAQYRSECP